MVIEWRAIPGFEQHYEISNRGDVRSIGGTFQGRFHKRPKPRPVVPAKERAGYLKVRLCANGTKRFYFIARLVLLAFVGPCPEGHQAAHLDGSKANNTPENLAWVTAKENIQQRDNHGTTARGDLHGMRIHKGLVAGENNGKARLTAVKVQEIRTRYKAGGVSQAALAVEYGVKEPAIWKIVNNLSWIVENGQVAEERKVAA